jgi:uncharacterized protein
MPHISALFIGLFAIVQIPLTVVVGYRRAKTGIQFFDEGDVTLRRRMRAHANFTETVPIVLIAMTASEQSGAPAWLLLAGGSLLAVGRALHYATLVRSGFGIGRAIGMVMTLLSMAGFGAWLLSLFVR